MKIGKIMKTEKWHTQSLKVYSVLTPAWAGTRNDRKWLCYPLHRVCQQSSFPFSPNILNVNFESMGKHNPFRDYRLPIDWIYLFVTQELQINANAHLHSFLKRICTRQATKYGEVEYLLHIWIHIYQTPSNYNYYCYRWGIQISMGSEEGTLFSLIVRLGCTLCKYLLCTVEIDKVLVDVSNLHRIDSLDGPAVAFKLFFDFVSQIVELLNYFLFWFEKHFNYCSTHFFFFFVVDRLRFSSVSLIVCILANYISVQIVRTMKVMFGHVLWFANSHWSHSCVVHRRKNWQDATLLKMCSVVRMHHAISSFARAGWPNSSAPHQSHQLEEVKANKTKLMLEFYDRVFELPSIPFNLNANWMWE